ncbi:MAG: DinB family protein [Acidobacteriota bacterium]
MNRRYALGSMVAAAAAVPLLKGQGSQVEDWVKWWENSKAYTLAIAEAMPAGDYNYVPFKNGDADAVRSFGGTMQHIGQAEGFYLGRFGKNGAAPQPPTLAGGGATKGKGPNYDMSKEATVKYLNELFTWSVGVVKQLTAEDLTKSFGNGKQPAMTGLDLLLNAMVHTAHTRGYADMYLRNKNVVPPTYKV